MVIYECVLEQIAEPFIGLADNDDLLMQDAAIATYEEEQVFIKQKIIENFARRHIDYLNSRNIQATLYYYLYCADRQRATRILQADLVCFHKFEVLFAALQEIHDAITQNIGALDVKCADFTENTEHFPPQLDMAEDMYAFMSK